MRFAQGIVGLEACFVIHAELETGAEPRDERGGEAVLGIVERVEAAVGGDEPVVGILREASVAEDDVDARPGARGRELDAGVVDIDGVGEAGGHAVAEGPIDEVVVVAVEDGGLQFPARERLGDRKLEVVAGGAPEVRVAAEQAGGHARVERGVSGDLSCLGIAEGEPACGAVAKRLLMHDLGHGRDGGVVAVGVVEGGAGFDRDALAVTEGPAGFGHKSELGVSAGVEMPLGERRGFEGVAGELRVVVERKLLKGVAPSEGDAAGPGGVLIEALGSETVVHVLVAVAAPEGPDFEPAMVGPGATVVECDEECLQVLSLDDAKRRVEVGPAEEFGLITGKQVGLVAFAGELEADIAAVEIVVAVGHRAIRLRTRQGHVGTEAEPAGAEALGVALIKFLPVGIVLAKGHGGRACGANGAPPVSDGAGVGVEAEECVIHADENRRRLKHRGRHRNLGEIVPGLGIVERHCADAETGVLKNATADRDVRLPFRKIARLHIDLRLVAQARHRHGKRAHHLLVGHTLRINGDRRELRCRIRTLRVCTTNGPQRTQREEVSVHRPTRSTRPQKNKRIVNSDIKSN